jgi:hypothetical protein
LSRGTTLEPGDIIFTGTPSGVGLGRDPPLWLKDGDVVEVSLEGVGSCTNRVEYAKPLTASRKDDAGRTSVRDSRERVREGAKL